MFRKLASTFIGPAVLAGVAWMTPTSLADDCKPDVDIDSLHAEVFADGNDWTVKVRYEVEIEDAHPQSAFVLGLQVKEDGYAVTDGNGQIWTATVALQAPVKVKGDEITFESCIDIRPPAGAIRCPDRLRLQSFVTFDGDSRWLDDEATSVKYCRPQVVVEYVQPVVEVVRPAPVVEIVRPAPITIVRPAPVVTYVRPAPIFVAHPVYARPVVVARRAYVAPARGVGVDVHTNNVHVGVGARW